MPESIIEADYVLIGGGFASINAAQAIRARDAQMIKAFYERALRSITPRQNWIESRTSWKT